MDYDPFALSIPDLNSYISIKISPNPTTDIVTLYFNNIISNSIIEILNTGGELIKSFKQQGAGQSIQLDLSSWASGLYIIKVITNENIITDKVLKL